MMAEQQIGESVVPAPDSSDDAVVGTDLKGEINYWNRAAERLFGYAAPEAIGRSVRLLIPAARQGEENYVATRVEQGETIDRFETLARRKDGTVVPVSMTISAVRAAQGDIVGAARIARDLSSRRRIEPGVLRLAAIVESSEDAIVELTEIVAWENASSKFNRALRIGSQGLWRRTGARPEE